MIEVFGDIWELAADNKASAIAITTNGFVKKNGNAVMGRGIALEAAQRYPGIESDLGDLLFTAGNEVWLIATDETYKFDVLTLPVKYNWWEKADIELIKKSIRRLVDFTDNSKYNLVLIPRPGCGNGKLKWEDVKPIIEPYLDDRFWICHK